MVYCGSVRQTAAIVSMSQEQIRTVRDNTQVWHGCTFWAVYRVARVHFAGCVSSGMGALLGAVYRVPRVPGCVYECV